MRTFESAQEGSDEELDRMDDPERDYIVMNREEMSDELLDQVEDSGSSMMATPDEILGISQGTSASSEYQPPPVSGGGSGSDLGGVLGRIEDALSGSGSSSSDRDISIELPNLDIQARTQKEILGIIASLGLQTAQMQRDMLEVAGTQARLGVRQSQELGNINFHLSPSRAITVSGTNSTSTADVPEPIVPEAENSDIPTNTLYIRASRRNDEPVYIGDDEVNPQSGFALFKGESQPLEINLVEQNLYMASEETGQTVELLGVV